MKKMRVHFVGVLGSGISSVAMIARSFGYEVSGCDQSESEDYLSETSRATIRVSKGHSIEHLKECDLLVASRVLLQDPTSCSEIEHAVKTERAIAWQQFLADYLVKDSFLICVSGTHGKTTTTAVLGEILIGSELEPTVVVGGRIKNWEENFHIGRSDMFLVEADEYSDNFQYFNPNVLIVTNTEFEHPDYYSTFDEYIESFARFISRARAPSIIVFNADNSALNALVNKSWINSAAAFRPVGFGRGPRPDWLPENEYARLSGTSGLLNMRFRGEELTAQLALRGDHNLYNVAAAVTTYKAMGVSPPVDLTRLENFRGANRRIDIKYSSPSVAIVDDYAHHPTEVEATLTVVQEIFDDREIVVVLEIHQIARYNAFFEGFDEALRVADVIYFLPIFEVSDFGLQGVDVSEIVTRSKHKNARAYSENSASQIVNNSRTRPTVVVTLGAALSTVANAELIEACRSDSLQ